MCASEGSPRFIIVRGAAKGRSLPTWSTGHGSRAATGDPVRSTSASTTGAPNVAVPRSPCHPRRIGMLGIGPQRCRRHRLGCCQSHHRRLEMEREGSR